MHTMDRLSDTERHRLDVLAGKYVSAYNAILDNKYIPTVSIETQIKENPEILELYNLLDKASLAVIKKDGTPKNPGVFGIGVFGLGGGKRRRSSSRRRRSRRRNTRRRR